MTLINRLHGGHAGELLQRVSHSNKDRQSGQAKMPPRCERRYHNLSLRALPARTPVAALCERHYHNLFVRALPARHENTAYSPRQNHFRWHRTKYHVLFVFQSRNGSVKRRAKCSRVEVSAVDGGTSIKDSGKHVDGSCESRAERDMFRSVCMGECVCLRTHVHICFYRPRAFHRAGPFVGLMKGWPQ